MRVIKKAANNFKPKAIPACTPKAALLEKRRSAVSMLLKDEIYPSGKIPQYQRSQLSPLSSRSS
jgi:hypothetical protein